MSEKRTPTSGRRFGYFISIVLNGLILYAVNNLGRWNVPFLTDQLSDCLWSVNLSIGVTIFMYCIFLVFDRRWFRSFMQAIANIFSLISIYVFRQVFPLKIPASYIHWVNLGLVIIMIITFISILVELLNSVRHYRNQSVSEESQNI